MERELRRRDFFKVLAAGGASAAAAAGCSDVPEKLIPLLVPPDNIDYVPGNPIDYATTCAECPAGCGMIMRTREGRAIKAEGNPDHPINRGNLCIRGQSSLQTLYNPARIPSAMLREGEEWREAEWDAAEHAAAERLRAVSDPSRIVLMTNRADGTRGQLLDQWLSALGASPKVVLDPLGQHAIKQANRRMFGRPEIPQYRIDRATFLLNFGSDFLETWLSPVRQNRQFAQMHAANDEERTRGRFVHVGPHLSLSGANADDWLPVRPGSETVVALAIARQTVHRNGRRVPPGDRARVEAFLRPFTLARAAEEAGVAEERLQALADEFARAEQSLALGGGTSLAHEAASDAHAAVSLLNFVAGNVGETVQFGAMQQIDSSSPFAEVLDAVRRMRSGEVDVLIVDGANPLYHLPPATGVEEALGRVGTIVSLSSAWDETTHRAHILLPGLTAYERWGDAFPQRGVFALRQPVMAPVFPVKAPEDTLISLGKALGLAGFEDGTAFRDYLMEAWREIQLETGSREPFEEFWRQSLQNGGVFRQVAFSSIVRLRPDALNRPLAQPSLEGNGLLLLPTPSLRHRSGEGSVNPWLQEIPDPLSQVVWDSWADINPETAKAHGISHGDQMVVRSPEGEVTVSAYYHYGVHRDVIAVPLGQGHSGAGRTADGRGVNIVSLLPAKTDADSGDFAFLSTRVTIERGEGRSFVVQLDGSPRQMGRGIIKTITPEQFAKGEKPADGHHAGGGEHPRRIDFYPERGDTPGYYEPYRWGMTIDVDRCTGCSACVAACYAENNVPVVGKERVALGREMSWLRIERFLEGEGDSYKTLMQPMLCQHCENAGCEPVCPVYATYHTPEGLNAQVYNRCVGTRYCANNCVYKVRRFNWFEYEYDSPLHLQLNPDVTVRSKGIMEKCTFCVQRIHRARYSANGQGRDIREGEVTPACVQTCPTSAIAFGNLADPNSAVARRALRGEHDEDKRVRQYEVLAETANKPGITYLRKVMDLIDGHPGEEA
ncbi:MAG: 4Fe-4S dicluster domain-containing protein [SAR324 cluster bacterium]|nr:4Fe-4S dicluster domain-containing protein [SAR324 cluster bacterium]